MSTSKAQRPKKKQNAEHLVHNKSNIESNMSVGLHIVSLIIQFQYFTFHVWTYSCRDCRLSPPESASMSRSRFLGEGVGKEGEAYGGNTRGGVGVGRMWKGGCKDESLRMFSLGK